MTLQPEPTDPTETRTGIVPSNQPPGWLGARWIADLTARAGPDRGIVSRGRTFARAGRVMALWFSPGLVTAEVSDTVTRQVSVRVRLFDAPEWHTVLDALSQDLRTVAGLMEGHLTQELVGQLERSGVTLLPDAGDLDGDCDCPDYRTPCAHMAAVHHVVADALDGDPTFLILLRGWQRAHLFAQLRRRWGDTERPQPSALANDGITDAPPPSDGDWLRAPLALPAMSVNLSEPDAGPVGLRALGTAPDNGDLERALGPLYDAGSRAAQRLFVEDDAPQPLRERPRALAEGGPAAPQAQSDDTPSFDDTPFPDDTPSPDDDEATFTESLVDALAGATSLSVRELAHQLEVGVDRVRAELRELEELGVVYRTGQTRGTRWWLG